MQYCAAVNINRITGRVQLRKKEEGREREREHGRVPRPSRIGASGGSPPSSDHFEFDPKRKEMGERGGGSDVITCLISAKVHVLVRKGFPHFRQELSEERVCFFFDRIHCPLVLSNLAEPIIAPYKKFIMSHHIGYCKATVGIIHKFRLSLRFAGSSYRRTERERERERLLDGGCVADHYYGRGVAPPHS